LKPIFYAHPTEESVAYIRERIKHDLPFFPVSTRELALPKVKLPLAGVLIATSGSSGKAKLAHLSLENLFYSAKFSHPDLALGPGDKYLLSVPLYHVSGLSIVSRCYFSGAEVVLPGSSKESEVTHISFVPTQLKRFLQNPKSYPKLKAILVGGAPIPFDLCCEAHSQGFPIYITYGMTEMTSQVATQKFDPKKGIAFGDPLPHRELKLVDGEIYVRGKTLFQGYHNLPPSFVDGWFPTNDLGQIGPHGLELIGRKDRMFISGGENIHPEELEKALLSHPSITRASVHSRTDPEFGARPSAFIETTLSQEAILEHLSSLLPKFKLPKKQDITLNPKDYFWTK
jgi:O-succinylbenzoic acid--CoA ligase